MSLPRRGDRDRILEACAEAQACSAVNVATGALWRFAHDHTTWGEVLEELSWAGAEADKARARNWDFLQDSGS